MSDKDVRDPDRDRRVSDTDRFLHDRPIRLAVITLLITVSPTSNGADPTASLRQVTVVYWSLLIATSLTVDEVGAGLTRRDMARALREDGIHPAFALTNPTTEADRLALVRGVPRIGIPWASPLSIVGALARDTGRLSSRKPHVV